jgi:hypothetical protein
MKQGFKSKKEKGIGSPLRKKKSEKYGPKVTKMKGNDATSETGNQDKRSSSCFTGELNLSLALWD